MLSRHRVVIVCLLGSAVSLAIFLWVSSATVMPLVARGAGPDGVHVEPAGWVAWFTSLVSTCGCTFGGLYAALKHRLGVGVPGQRTTLKSIMESQVVSDVIDCGEEQLIAALYSQTKDAALKNQLRLKLKAVHDALFDRDFPADSTAATGLKI